MMLENGNVLKKLIVKFPKKIAMKPLKFLIVKFMTTLDFVFNVTAILDYGIVLILLGNVLKTNSELEIVTNMMKIKIVLNVNGQQEMKI